jgi:hypothetical protein
MEFKESNERETLLQHIKDLRQELELSNKLREACEKQRQLLERKVIELLAEITSISRMEGRE